MDSNTSTTQTGGYSIVETIPRQSSDRNSETGLITYQVHTVPEIRLSGQLTLGQWEHHEVALTPDVVAVLCERMGVTLEKLQQIGDEYSTLLRAIVEYNRNKPTPEMPPIEDIQPPTPE